MRQTRSAKLTMSNLCVAITSVLPARHRQVEQRIQHVGARVVVKVSCRFVSEDEPGFMKERAGDGDALLLAAA